MSVPGGIQGNCLKLFRSIRKIIALQLDNCLQFGAGLEWMIEEKTTLLMKDRSKKSEVGNYRPINCLNLPWKVITRPRLSHPLFVDDLKIFAQKEPEVERLVETVKFYCKDIGMELGV